MKSKSLALITGASSGIGEALSRELVQRGLSVIGMARSEDKLASIQNFDIFVNATIAFDFFCHIHLNLCKF